jgi:hypothetical protein
MNPAATDSILPKLRSEDFNVSASNRCAVFAAAIAALLVICPGPLFTGASLSETNLSETFSDAMPMDYDDPQTIELHAKAKSARKELYKTPKRWRGSRRLCFH